MSIVATERWSGRGYGLNNGQWEAQRTADVSGTTDPNAAIAALSSQLGIAYNAPHPFNPYIFCSGITLSEPKGPEFLTFQATYAMPQFGQFPDPAQNPLNRPIRISWRRCTRSVETDVTVDSPAKPILNSALDPFEPRPQVERFTRMLSIKRNEPFYNIALAEAFEGRVNDTAGYLGPLLIGQYQCICHQIEPTGEYGATAGYVEIEYLFEIDRSSQYPFNWNYIDRGKNGWYDASGTPRKGLIVDAKNQEIAYEPLLDGTGKPLDASLKIRSGSKETDTAAPISAPNLPPGPSGFLTTYSAGACKVLVFNRTFTANFQSLGLT